MNPIVRQLAPSATKMIRMDHTHTVALFHKIEPDMSETVHSGVVRGICTALEVHAQLEEEIFYPALREAGVTSQVLEKSVPEHDDMRRLIERVRAFHGQRSPQDDAVNVLMRAVLHHVADEETDLLPAAERQMGAERLSELGAQMTERRLQLLKPRAGELAIDMAKAAPAKTALMAVGAVLAGTWLLRALSGRRHNSYSARV